MVKTSKELVILITHSFQILSLCNSSYRCFIQNIQMVSTFSVSEECLCDITVSNPVYGYISMIKITDG